MKCEILIVTFARDFQYLKFFLRSADKFATGFSGITILVPEQDERELIEVVTENSKTVPVRCLTGCEWEGKGFLWHECMICHADEICPDADVICHADPDIAFTEPVTPLTFVNADGKPLLRYEPFDSIGRRHPGVLKWKEAAENALPFKVENEHMRGHCHCYTRETYSKVREQVQKKTGMLFDDYVASCTNSFPQTFAEHPTIGAVAFEFFKEKYVPFDCSTQLNPDYCHYPVFQAWSHAAPEQLVDLWYRGQQIRIAPLDFYKELGLAK